MYEYKSEVIWTGLKWLSDKASKTDVSNFDDVFNARAADGWELVAYDYMATSVQVRGALLATFRRQK